MKSLTDPIFTDETAAREFLEKNRWPDGPVCPHCGERENIRALKGKAHRPGLYQCNACRQQFSVTVGTLFERSKVPLHKWLLATFLLTSSKTGMSAHQLYRMLGLGSYRTAWFMFHRIREAMGNDSKSPLGGAGGEIQADETYFGSTSKRAKSYKKGLMAKRKIVTLVEPGGRSRSVHVPGLSAHTVRNVLVRNADRKSRLVTDESPLYRTAGREFDQHKRVWHASGKYVSPDGHTTNAVENFFGVFKRGMRGTYSFCGEQHLQRYLNEFDFRYSHRKISDRERTEIALRQIEGKRLTYRRTNEARYS